MGQIEWTNVILGFFTLLGGCGWFVEGRKHRQAVSGMKADNRLKDMELAHLYVQYFEETIGCKLRKQVDDLEKEVARLTYAIQRIDVCTHRDKCPVRDGMREQQKGHDGKEPAHGSTD